MFSKQLTPFSTTSFTALAPLGIFKPASWWRSHNFQFSFRNFYSQSCHRWPRTRRRRWWTEARPSMKLFVESSSNTHRLAESRSQTARFDRQAVVKIAQILPLSRQTAHQRLSQNPLASVMRHQFFFTVFCVQRLPPSAQYRLDSGVPICSNTAIGALWRYNNFPSPPYFMSMAFFSFIKQWWHCPAKHLQAIYHTYA